MRWENVTTFSRYEQWTTYRSSGCCSARVLFPDRCFFYTYLSLQKIPYQSSTHWRQWTTSGGSRVNSDLTLNPHNLMTQLPIRGRFPWRFEVQFNLTHWKLPVKFLVWRISLRLMTDSERPDFSPNHQSLRGVTRNMNKTPTTQMIKSPRSSLQLII